MAADDAVDAEARGLIGDSCVEVADELHGVLHFVLEEAGERPVGQVEPAADAVHDIVGPEQIVVEPGPPRIAIAREQRTTLRFLSPWVTRRRRPSALV